MADVKTCSGCGKEKPADLEHYGEKRGKWRPTCRACERDAQAARHREMRATEQAHLAEPDVARLESCAEWGTGLEREAIRALAEKGSLAAAAESLGMSALQLRNRLSDLERRAARRGWSPAHDMTATTPEGMLVKGVSTFYRVEPDGTRTATGQWVKTQADADHKLEAMMAAIETGADKVRGVADPVEPPAAPLAEDLLCVYPMGDPHLGMHAWAAEAGDDFDLRIAERELFSAVDHLVSLAPPAEHALVLNLGDFFHFDGPGGTTTKGTRVDVDTRPAKVYGAGVRTMIRIIGRALERHRRVTVRCNIGNHDEYTSMMLGVCLAAYYEREPRVTVDTSPSPFTRYRHGKCLIATTHGNDVKHADLESLMAADWAEDWGSTSFRQWYIGHVHHEKVLERRGCVVESFRTLAAKDAWHHRSGYRSGRDMRLDVWHAQYGLVNRHIVGIQQLRGELT